MAFLSPTRPLPLSQSSVASPRSTLSAPLKSLGRSTSISTVKIGPLTINSSRPSANPIATIFYVVINPCFYIWSPQKNRPILPLLHPHPHQLILHRRHHFCQPLLLLWLDFHSGFSTSSLSPFNCPLVSSMAWI